MDKTAPPLKRRHEPRLERENQLRKRQPELTLVGGDGKRTGTDTARLYLGVAHFKKAYATQTQRTGVVFKCLGTPTPLWETCPRG